MRARASSLAGCAAVLALAVACEGNERAVAAGRAESVAQASAATTTDTSAQGFWTAFRAAALANDTARLASLTQFPVETRGPMDGDPIERVSRDGFAALFARVMRQDPGLAAQPETMRALLERTTSLGARERGPEQFRVGALEFARTAAGWRLVRAYLDE